MMKGGLVVCVIAGATGCGVADALPPGPDGGHRFPGDALAATRDAGAPSSCIISTSNYDQSCNSNADCVNLAGKFPVHGGDYCQPMCLCGVAAINGDAVNQYIADLLKTPLGSGAIAASACDCPDAGVPCCSGGKCTVSACQPFNLAPEVFPDGSTLCTDHGPADGGSDAGRSLWCIPPSQCMPFNGQWACCQETGPNLVFCIPSSPSDK